MARRTEGATIPEGPEVKRSADYLSKLLVGKRIRNVTVVGGRYGKKPPEGLDEFLGCATWAGALDLPDYGRIEAIKAKGKFMYWHIRPDWLLWCTYGMSGQWVTGEPDKHVAVSIQLDDGQVHFRDPRHFGTLKFVNDRWGDKLPKKLGSLGPDMLADPPPTHEQFAARLRRKPGRTLAEALMDQSCVSGVGNYVKAESLYLAELSPRRIASNLTDDELKRLRQQVTNVMRASYNTGGATISTYRNVDGSKGEAQRCFMVYGHSEDPLGNPVTREATMDGRTTWWVPAVQK